MIVVTWPLGYKACKQCGKPTLAALCNRCQEQAA